MKSLLVLALALAASPLASAQMYKYLDKDGKTVYSDQAPPNTDTKQLNIPSGVTSSPAAAPKNAVERDKDLQKGRDEARDRAKKADDAVKQAEAKDQQCAAAKMAYQTYADGGRIAKYNDKGERIFLGDEEIDAERERSKREMDEACKKS
jgi:Domain of unknown function (DUF4124)